MEVERAIRFFKRRAQSLMPLQNRGDYDREDLVQEALLKWVASDMQSVKVSTFAMHDYIRRCLTGTSYKSHRKTPVMIEFEDYHSERMCVPSLEESAIHAQFIENTVDSLSPGQMKALHERINGGSLKNMRTHSARLRAKFGYRKDKTPKPASRQGG